MKTLTIAPGYTTFVDDEDYDLVAGRKWHARPDKRRDGTVRNIYVMASAERGTKPRKTLYLHRVIMNAPKGMHVDHIDGNALNNTRANLRICTPTENNRNQHGSRGKSKFKGVSWYKQFGKWGAHIRVHDMLVHLGSFSVEIDAALAYDAAAIKHFGEFARLNLPEAMFEAQNRQGTLPTPARQIASTILATGAGNNLTGA